ncbi:MAG: hypothetical protein JRH20_28060, partial [Deltaproteobacteria bacterium]|nr:hypothetical protein [Deltaproteobacteria bacterium]
MSRSLTLLFIASLFVAACDDDAVTPDADAGPDAADAFVDASTDGPRVDSPRMDGPRMDGLRMDGPAYDGPRADIAVCADPGATLPAGVTVFPSRLVAGQTVTVRYSGKLAQS